jgi:hypothetical protein
MRAAKRGRPRIGRRAMSGAQRQARWRRHKREVEAERLRQQGLEPPHQPYQPPIGYATAKEKLIKEGHVFTRANRDAGFEHGVFVDGAFLSSHHVLVLAEMPRPERDAWLAEHRRETKDFACSAVMHFMTRLRVSLDDLSDQRDGRRR